jgi:hypothetical protein
MEVATVANNTPFSEKIRIDSASIEGGLSKDVSATVTAFDNFSIDSNKLMIAFSPQHVINEDIYESIGNTIIDDYFGEYENTKRDEYPRLKQFAREYWKKYTNRNDFTAYLRMVSIFDFSLFDQIRQTLPVRSNEILGLVIEPNILERSKVKTSRDFGGLGPDRYVRDTSEISASAVIVGSVNNSKSTTVFVGFDEDILSEFTNISGEFDIEETFEAETQNLEDDVDVNTNLIVTASYTNASISSRQREIIALKTNEIGLIDKEPPRFIDNTINNMSASIKVIGKNSLIGKNNTLLETFGSLDLGFSNTFDRINVIHGSTTGVGDNWYTASNAFNKKTSLFEMISSSRDENFYKTFKFYYTSSLNVEGTNWTSFDYLPAGQMNQGNYTTSVRNARFDGCKLPDNDVTNKISFPMYTPNYSYLDANDDPSALIILILPFEVLPEWLQRIRAQRR